MSASHDEIVLLPGLDGSGKLFAALEPLLAPHMRVTVVPYSANAGWSYDDYATDVIAALGARRVVLLGESFSGPIAIKVAARCQQQVRGVVLSSTFVRPPWPGWLLRRAAAVNMHRLPRALKTFGLLGFNGPKSVTDQLWPIVDRVPAAVLAARLREVARVDVSELLGNLNVPILVLHGRSDLVVPALTLKSMTVLNTRLTVRAMPGPHMLLQAMPEMASRHIIAFVKALGR